LNLDQWDIIRLVGTTNGRGDLDQEVDREIVGGIQRAENGDGDPVINIILKGIGIITLGIVGIVNGRMFQGIHRQ